MRDAFVFVHGDELLDFKASDVALGFQVERRMDSSI